VAFGQMIDVKSIDAATLRRRQDLALDLLCAQAGQMQAPLQELLLACTGGAYHHAGKLPRGRP
jgi:hypothetical protein